MKKILLVTVAVGSVALSAFADRPYYKTLSGNGNATTPAQVIFPAAPLQQIRIVNANWSSDTNNAALNFSGGTTGYSIVETNQASTSVTNKINSTNGLSANAVLVLQHAGVGYAATVSTWNSSTNSGPYGGTNVVLASGGWGMATSVGDDVYLMDTPVAVPIGATTNAMNGDALYVANLVARPVLVKLTPALATNKLNSVVGRYEY
jgi:hypothetical protein